VAALALAACAADNDAPATPRDGRPQAAAQAVAPQPATPGRETITLDVAGRKVDMLVSRPALIRGVAIFGHGLGGAPGNYGRLFKALNDRGWLVVAPLNVDSLSYRGQRPRDERAAFSARIADQGAAAELGRRLAPGQPLVAVGHSFGALIASIKGGALANIAPARDPGVKAVLMFSSPGRIPGLSVPENFRSLAVPTMMVTGTQDVIPILLPDPRAHLTVVEGAPKGTATALVVRGGGHNMIERDSGPGRDTAVEAALDFLDAYGRGDTKALARVRALRSSDRVEVRRS